VLDLVGDHKMSADDVARVQQVIVDTGALDELEAHITALVAEAVDAITTTPVEPTAVDELVTLAEYVSARRT
jgi:geranylgeranyl pyrophosphate synthase